MQQHWQLTRASLVHIVEYFIVITKDMKKIWSPKREIFLHTWILSVTFSSEVNITEKLSSQKRFIANISLA